MSDDPLRPPYGGEEDDESTAGLPRHEIDEDDTVGGGVMSAGGTAVDRGTGELSGSAQGEEEADAGGINEGMIAGPPAGGAQSYVPAFIDDDDDAGGSLPDA